MTLFGKLSSIAPALIGLLVLSTTTLVYTKLGEPSLLIVKGQTATELSTTTDITPRLERLQTQIKADTQNGHLWFELGNEYMSRGEFKNAALVYHYAERLSESPSADVFAAQATAKYYANGQRFDQSVERWLNDAISIQPDNAAANMLLASEYFLSAQYALAIRHWTIILDANHPDTDRAAVIASINQAKRMIK
ncbi:hypothetical protein [Grimontia indica]|uniref:hypothetical protein n=1 Tax=Grimontia indica TaxID=1056512 RepID=UPI00068F9DF0|nr:hypothetical protein [Grimontia indica]